jgi:O-antigen/teichoic acid export membrane protein
MITRVKNTFFQNIKFIKHLGSSYAVMFANYGTLFFLTPFLIHKLGTENYGIWLLVSNIINYFNLTNLGFNTSFTVEFPKVRENKEELDKLFNTVFFTLIYLSIVAIVVFIGLYLNFDIFKISSTNLDTAKNTFLIVFLIFTLNLITTLFDSILFITNNINTKNTFDVVRVLLIGISTFLIVKFGYSIVAIAFGNLLITLVYQFFVFRAAKKVANFSVDPSKFDRQIFKKMFSSSWHYFIIGLGNQVVFFSDNILISILKGVSYVSMYATMYRLTDVSLKLISKIVDTKYPKIVQLNSENRFADLLKLHNKLLKITFIVSLPVFLILFFWGVDLIKLWIGDQYFLDDRILKIFAVFLMMYTCLHVTGLFVVGMGIHRRVSYMITAEAILNLSLSYLFFKKWDLVGIALGTFIAHFLTIGWFIYYEFYTNIYRKTKETQDAIS